MSEQDQADPKVLGNEKTEGVMPSLGSEMDTPVANSEWRLVGIDKDLTPLQYHYLSLLQRLVALKNSYQTDVNHEAWMMGAMNKSVYATLRDCIEANVGDEAKELLNREQHVN
jgi:hypothetical protein